MKILHILNHFWPSQGGIEKFTLSQCLHSKKNGLEVSVICLNKPAYSNKILPENETVFGIPVRRVPFVDWHYYKPVWIPLSELKKADIIHLHGVSALSDFVVLTKFLHRKKIVLNTHGGLFHTKAIPLLKKLYFFGLQRLMLHGVDLVIADSKNDFALFKPIAPRMVFLENGVGLEPFFPNKKTVKKDNRFIFVGRLSKNKAIDQLLRVFAQAKEKGIDFELVIVGADWEKLQQQLEELAATLGIRKNVRFAGAVSEEELIGLLQSARFFVSASRYEGFGISLIEAMAAGCIPIVNSIDSFKNFIDPPKNGFLADFGNEPEAVQVIQQAVQSDWNAISKTAQSSVRHFSWNSKIKDWKKLYESVLEKKR